MHPGALICPACGGVLVPAERIASFEPALGPRELQLARCRGCASAVTLGPPVTEAHMAGAYGGGRPRGARLAAPLLALFDRQRLGLLPAPPARLIDAGAGRGRFLRAALDAGYDALGLEPSLRAVDPQLPLAATTIEAAEIAAASADIVTLWHVLEHLEDPRAALAAVHRWLTPGGSLLVGVPNLGSLQARLTRERWYHLDLPRHRTHFSVDGLVALLERSGFEVIAVHHLLLEQNIFGMWQSLTSLGTRRPSYLYNLLKRNAPLFCGDLAVTVAALVLLPTAALLELLAGLTRRGGSVAVLARRR